MDLLVVLHDGVLDIFTRRYDVTFDCYLRSSLPLDLFQNKAFQPAT